MFKQNYLKPDIDFDYFITIGLWEMSVLYEH